MILVTGARGVVGTPLCAALREQSRAFTSVSRSTGDGVCWDLRHPLNDEQIAQLKNLTTIFHCAPIWLLPEHIEQLAKLGLQRVIAFSSTSVLSKRNSTDASEQRLVEMLSTAESDLSTHCSDLNIDLTILRPSLIYGYGRDQNISHIAKFIAKWGVMFLVGKAQGQRQPVHADDLVMACLACESNAATFGQAYNLAGHEVLSYREMVVRIFQGMGKTPRIVSIPLAFYRAALYVAAKLGSFNYTAAMADRMNQNLSYDISAAQTDFGFQPQVFLAHPERDLVTGQ